jgi:hypothetical protein
MLRRVRRYLAVPLAVAMLAIATFASAPAGAAGPGSYIVSRQNGVPFTLMSSRNLLVGAADDSLVYMSTTFTGVNRMPFPVTIYGKSFSKMTISTNGNIQFGVCCTGGTAAFTNQSLPTATFAKPMLAVFWDDLFMTPDDLTHPIREGIFVLTTGTKPHRQLTISFQGHAFSNETYFVLAQAVFTEGSQTIKFRYATADDQNGFTPSETIGVQGPGGALAHATQVAFNPNPGATTAGRQYTFQHTP